MYSTCMFFLLTYLNFMISHSYLRQNKLLNSKKNCKHLLMLNSDNEDRNFLWKKISEIEKDAVQLISKGDEQYNRQVFKLLCESSRLKASDPFLQLANTYNELCKNNGNDIEKENILLAMERAGLPPHLADLSSRSKISLTVDENEPEDVDPGSTFSDTVTEKIRVKVNSFFDQEKSDPANGKFMFWYKVVICNEGPEPVQIVARMWEIEKCRGEKEIVRGAGIMSTQPIIPPGDVFTYQSVCPLKVFPPKGKRVIGNMQGAYTMCKGNMGQHNFTVKVGKFNLILPESVAAAESSSKSKIE